MCVWHELAPINENALTVTIYGKPASGKSHLMKYILCCMRAEGKIHILFVFNSTKK